MKDWNAELTNMLEPMREEGTKAERLDMLVAMKDTLLREI